MAGIGLRIRDLPRAAAPPAGLHREAHRDSRLRPAQRGGIVTHQMWSPEGEYRAQLEPIRPRAKRTAYHLRVGLAAVVDVTDAAVRHRLGLVDADLADMSMTKTAVGGRSNGLVMTGMLVPSIRAKGANLVIFPNRMEERDGRLDGVDSEVNFDPDE